MGLPTVSEILQAMRSNAQDIKMEVEGIKEELSEEKEDHMEIKAEPLD